MDETVVPVTRPCVGGSMSSRKANNGRLPHGLGSGHEWPIHPRSVGRSPSHVAHQLTGDAGSIQSFETLSPRPERPSCASAHRQYIGGLLHIKKQISCRDGLRPGRMETPHGANLEEVWSSPGGLVCVSRDLTMSLLILSNSSSSIGVGCHGKDVAEASSDFVL